MIGWIKAYLRVHLGITKVEDRMNVFEKDFKESMELAMKDMKTVDEVVYLLDKRVTNLESN